LIKSFNKASDKNEKSLIFQATKTQKFIQFLLELRVVDHGLNMIGKILSFLSAVVLIATVFASPSYRTYSDDDLERKISPEDRSFSRFSLNLL
jgi:hypothetical protein